MCENRTFLKRVAIFLENMYAIYLEPCLRHTKYSIKIICYYCDDGLDFNF